MTEEQAEQKLRLEYRSASELAENPQNWRRHPDSQTEALRDVIDRVGWAGACLFNEKTGRLIDGHARKEISGDAEIPVLVGSWSEEQERLILATLDPLGAMAETDGPCLEELLAGVETDSAAIQRLLDGIKPEAIDDAVSPEDFGEFDDDIETEHRCPKCGYVWSGKAK